MTSIRYSFFILLFLAQQLLFSQKSAAQCAEIYFLRSKKGILSPDNTVNIVFDKTVIGRVSKGDQYFSKICTPGTYYFSAALPSDNLALFSKQTIEVKAGEKYYLKVDILPAINEPVLTLMDKDKGESLFNDKKAFNAALKEISLDQARGQIASRDESLSDSNTPDGENDSSIRPASKEAENKTDSQEKSAKNTKKEEAQRPLVTEDKSKPASERELPATTSTAEDKKPASQKPATKTVAQRVEERRIYDEKIRAASEVARKNIIYRQLLIEGKAYKTVKIGDQTWMAENLSVNKFANGDPIQEANSYSEWSKATDGGNPAWCYYDGKTENGDIYGKMYSLSAVTDPRGLAPKGWHVATYEDWKNLIDATSDLRRKLSENDMKPGITQILRATAWDQYALDYFGFSALPGGFYKFVNTHEGIKQAAYWWHTGKEDEFSNLVRIAGDRISFIQKGNATNAAYVRLVKD